MILRMTPLAHEKVLLFYEVNTSRDQNERCGNKLLEAVVQIDYLTRGGDVPGGLFSRLLC